MFKVGLQLKPQLYGFGTYVSLQKRDLLFFGGVRLFDHLQMLLQIAELLFARDQLRAQSRQVILPLRLVHFGLFELKMIIYWAQAIAGYVKMILVCGGKGKVGSQCLPKNIKNKIKICIFST